MLPRNNFAMQWIDATNKMCPYHATNKVAKLNYCPWLSDKITCPQLQACKCRPIWQRSFSRHQQKIKRIFLFFFNQLHDDLPGTLVCIGIVCPGLYQQHCAVRFTLCTVRCSERRSRTDSCPLWSWFEHDWRNIGREMSPLESRTILRKWLENYLKSDFHHNSSTVISLYSGSLPSSRTLLGLLKFLPSCLRDGMPDQKLPKYRHCRLHDTI